MRHDYHKSRERTARRTHTCEECRSRIGIGERYSEKSGISDGTPYRARMCQMCSAVSHVVWALCDGQDDDGPYIGALAEWIHENEDLPWFEPKGSTPYDWMKAAFDTIERWRNGIDIDVKIRQYRDEKNTEKKY